MEIERVPTSARSQVMMKPAPHSYTVFSSGRKACSKIFFPDWAEENLVEYFRRASWEGNPHLSEPDVFEKFADLFAHAPQLLKHPAIIRVKKIWRKEGNTGRAKIARLERLAGKEGQIQVEPAKRRGRGRPKKAPEAFDLLEIEFRQIVQALRPHWKKARRKYKRHAEDIGFWDELSRSMAEAERGRPPLREGLVKALVEAGLMREEPLRHEVSRVARDEPLSFQEAARRILANRYGLEPRTVRDALIQHRREIRAALKEGRLEDPEGIFGP